MEKVFKIILIVICLVIAINFASINRAEAKTNNVVLQIDKENSCFFVFVRVQEGQRRFIYVYTETGIYITKIEEL